MRWILNSCNFLIIVLQKSLFGIYWRRECTPQNHCTLKDCFSLTLPYATLNCCYCLRYIFNTKRENDIKEWQPKLNICRFFDKSFINTGAYLKFWVRQLELFTSKCGLRRDNNFSPSPDVFNFTFIKRASPASYKTNLQSVVPDAGSHERNSRTRMENFFWRPAVPHRNLISSR